MLVAGANATPALASDGLEDLGMAELVVPETAIPEPTLVPDPDEPPIVVDTSIDAGDLDVSVRILSPGEDAVEAPISVPSDVISGALDPDITVDPVNPDAPTAVTATVEPDTIDTNVAVRVLSPGNNGPVGQGSGLAGDVPAAASPAEAPAREPEPALAATRPRDTAVAPAQYHEDNTQYQSELIFDTDPWVWEWYLALDCSGITTSTSSEIGSPDSRDWKWIWTWDWTCGLDGASEQSGDALQGGVASIASVNAPAGGGGSGAPDRTSPANDGQPEASGEPWLWTWTFDFCGRETTFSIQAGTQTSLQWTWDWTWAWACTSAPVTGGEGPSGTAAASDAPSGALELPPPLAIVTAPLLSSDLPTYAAPTYAAPSPLLPSVVAALDAAPSPLVPSVFETPVAIPAAIPSGPPASRTLATGPRPEPAPASGPGGALAPTTDIAAPTSTEPKEERARPPKPRGRDATPRPARLPKLPLSPARRAAGGPGSSGGSAPSGGASSGVAALTGLYVLAAPGLGRRLRDVRELSPRARSYAPLDRPG